MTADGGGAGFGQCAAGEAARPGITAPHRKFGPCANAQKRGLFLSTIRHIDTDNALAGGRLDPGTAA